MKFDKILDKSAHECGTEMISYARLLYKGYQEKHGKKIDSHELVGRVCDVAFRKGVSFILRRMAKEIDSYNPSCSLKLRGIYLDLPLAIEFEYNDEEE